jgi:hypothetical protein
VAGLALAAAGLAVLGHAPVGGYFATDVLPGAILLGTGAGTALPRCCWPPPATCRPANPAWGPPPPPPSQR